LAKWRNSELSPAARQYSRARGKLQNFLRKKKPVTAGENDCGPARISGGHGGESSICPKLCQ
jgi:hypothetical protein